MKITLHYYAINRSRFPEPVAVAECEARITKKTIVVHHGTTANNKGIRLGGMPYRFTRKTGRSIPNWLGRHSWDIAPGEIDRIEAEIELLNTSGGPEDYPANDGGTN